MKKKKIPNFITRSWKSKKTGQIKYCYYHRASLSNNRELTPLGTNYQQALQKWAEIEGLQMEPPKTGSLTDTYNEYMEWANNSKISKLKPRTIKDREAYWKKLGPVFGSCQIDSIKSDWLIKYFEERSSQVSAKKELKFLSVIFNWAKMRGKMRSPNPLDGIMRNLSVNEKRDIYVDDFSYELTIKHASQFVRDAMEATYLFCNRPSESAASKLTDIEDDEIVIKLKKTEGRGFKEKRIPVTGKRLDYINRQKQRNPRPLFLVCDENYQPLKFHGKFIREFKAARDAAEAEAKELKAPYTRFQLRDLRAKAATDIARDFGIEAARLMCGHTTQKQTSDYIRSVKGAAAKALKVAELGK